jgi:hypothetical protein
MSIFSVVAHYALKELLSGFCCYFIPEQSFIHWALRCLDLLIKYCSISIGFNGGFREVTFSFIDMCLLFNTSNSSIVDTRENPSSMFSACDRNNEIITFIRIISLFYSFTFLYKALYWWTAGCINSQDSSAKFTFKSIINK